MAIADVQNEVEIKPTMHCVGIVNEVSEPKRTQTDWDAVTISIQGAANSPDTRIYCMFDLGFFRGEDPIAARKALRERGISGWADVEKGSPEHRTLVAAMQFERFFQKLKGSIALTLGERYADFDASLDRLGDDLSPETFANTLRDYLVGATVLYKLKQGREKQTDGSKVLTPFYDCESFQAYNDDAVAEVERIVKYSRSKGNTVLVAWEEGA